MKPHIDLSLQRRLDKIDDCMQHAPGYYYITDLFGRALYMNANLLNDGGVSLTEVLGDTVFCEASRKYEAMYKRNQDWVLKNQRSLEVYEVVEDHRHKTSIVATHKQLFRHKEKIIGVCGMSLKIPVTAQCLANRFSDSLFFIDTQRSVQLELSQRQQEVLFYLLQGDSAKAVARRLQISARTVEHNIESIKDVHGYLSLKEILLSVRAV